jgi:hypothetical protein
MRLYDLLSSGAIDATPFIRAYFDACRVLVAREADCVPFDVYIDSIGEGPLAEQVATLLDAEMVSSADDD